MMTPPLTTAQITEDDIAHYLLTTPDFFARHAGVLAMVQLVSPHGERAISLQERQALMLRERIKRLEDQLMQMVQHGNENVVLSDKLLSWTRTLFLNTDALILPEQIAAEIQAQFGISQVSIKVWGVALEFAQAPFAQNVSEDAKLLASSLREPVCGLNAGFDVVNWFADPSAVASLAMLPLRTGLIGSAAPAFGLLVLASPDAQHFHKDLNTEFLARLGELASAALSKLR